MFKQQIAYSILLFLAGCSKTASNFCSDEPIVSADNKVWATVDGVGSSQLIQFQTNLAGELEIISRENFRHCASKIAKLPSSDGYLSYGHDRNSSKSLDGSRPYFIWYSSAAHDYEVKRKLPTNTVQCAIFPKQRTMIAMLTSWEDREAAYPVLKVFRLVNDAETLDFEAGAEVRIDFTNGSWLTDCKLTENPLQHWLCLTTTDGYPSVWNVEENEILPVRIARFESPLSDVGGFVDSAVSPDWQHVVVTKTLIRDDNSRYCEVCIWELASGARRYATSIPSCGGIASVAFIDDVHVAVRHSGQYTVIDIESEVVTSATGNSPTFQSTEIEYIQNNRFLISKPKDRGFCFTIERLMTEMSFKNLENPENLENPSN